MLRFSILFINGKTFYYINILYNTRYPLDVVQTQLTVQTTTTRYTGMIHTFSTMAKEEGVLSLYRGLTVTILVRIYSALTNGRVRVLTLH